MSGQYKISAGSKDRLEFDLLLCSYLPYKADGRSVVDASAMPRKMTVEKAADMILSGHRYPGLRLMKGAGHDDDI